MNLPFPAGNAQVWNIQIYDTQPYKDHTLLAKLNQLVLRKYYLGNEWRSVGYLAEVEGNIDEL